MSLRSLPIKQFSLSVLMLISTLASGWGLADEVEVVDADVVCQSGSEVRLCDFAVTLRHEDSGWDHYANQWQIHTVDDGRVLGTRKLLHPHVNEQPFTRQLSKVRIPEGIRQLDICGFDSVHGRGRQCLRVSVPETVEGDRLL